MSRKYVIETFDSMSLKKIEIEIKADTVIYDNDMIVLEEIVNEVPHVKFLAPSKFIMKVYCKE